MGKRRSYKYNKIDLLANRTLYAVYEVWIFFMWVVDWTFGYPLYSILFFKKRINKVNGVEDFKSYRKRMQIPKRAFLPNRLVLLMFFLPIFLLFNILTIVFGGPLTLFYRINPFLFILIAIIVALSGFLCHYFYERENRFLVFFSKFEKEHLSKRIIWIVATFATIVLLIVANIKMFCYINDIH